MPQSTVSIQIGGTITSAQYEKFRARLNGLMALRHDVWEGVIHHHSDRVPASTVREFCRDSGIPYQLRVINNDEAYFCFFSPDLKYERRLPMDRKGNPVLSIEHLKTLPEMPIKDYLAEYEPKPLPKFEVKDPIPALIPTVEEFVKKLDLIDLPPAEAQTRDTLQHILKNISAAEVELGVWEASLDHLVWRKRNSSGDDYNRACTLHGLASTIVECIKKYKELS